MTKTNRNNRSNRTDGSGGAANNPNNGANANPNAGTANEEPFVLHTAMTEFADLPKTTMDNDIKLSKAVMMTACVHYQNVKEEKDWLLEGQKTMSKEFLQEMYLRIMSEDDFVKYSMLGRLPDPKQTIKWMIDNRDKDLARTSAHIRYQIALIKRQEEAMKAKHFNNDNNNGGGSGANGAGMAV